MPRVSWAIGLLVLTDIFSKTYGNSKITGVSNEISIPQDKQHCSCSWTPWMNSGGVNPDGTEDETYDTLRKSGFQFCESPVDIQCYNHQLRALTSYSNIAFAATCDKSFGAKCSFLCDDLSVRVGCCSCTPDASGELPITTTTTVQDQNRSDEFERRFATVESKLLQAEKEIRNLKAKNQELTETLSCLHASLQTSCESSSTASKRRECPTDVMFLLDGSRSVGSNGFELAKNWVKSLAQRITSHHPSVQLGVLQFSHYYRALAPDNQLYIRRELNLEQRSYTDFVSAVDQIQLMGYTTFTAAALRAVKQDFLNSTNYNITGSVQLMILITDGRSDDFDRLPDDAAALREIGVIPFAVGVGDYLLTELRIIATGDVTSDKRVTEVARFSDLQSIPLNLTAYINNC